MDSIDTHYRRAWRRVRGWLDRVPSMAAVELGVLLLAALIADGMLAPAGLAGLTFNPLWAVVVFAALRHGTGTGVVATLGATAIHISHASPVDPLADDALGHVAHVGLLPLLWLLSAVAIGEMRRSQLRREEALLTEVTRLRREDENLQAIVRVLQKELDDVTIQRAAEADMALFAHEVMCGVNKVSLDGWGDWAVGVVRTLLQPTKFSLYLLHTDGMELVRSVGWSADDRYPRHIAQTSPLYRRIVGEQQGCLAAVHQADAEVLGQSGILACPLVSPGGDKILGMLKIEAMPFADFNVALFARTRVAATWISATLVDLKARQPVHAPARVHAGTESGEITFQRQVSFVKGLSERVGFDVAVVVLTPTLADDLKATDRIAVREALREAISGLRTSDWVVQAGGEHDSAVIMLPKTTAANAQPVARKIQAVAQGRLPPALSHIRIKAFVGPLSALSSRSGAEQREAL